MIKPFGYDTIPSLWRAERWFVTMGGFIEAIKSIAAFFFASQVSMALAVKRRMGHVRLLLAAVVRAHLHEKRDYEKVPVYKIKTLRVLLHCHNFSPLGKQGGIKECATSNNNVGDTSGVER